MPRRDGSEFARVLPRLRHNFETSRRLVTRSVERATRLADEAEATKRLLESRPKHTPAQASESSADIWSAAALELTRTSRERDRELGVVAHELRQSLMAAITADRLLAGGTNPETVERARAVVSRQLMNLSQLVEDLLDYSRLSFHAPARRRSINLAHVAGDAIDIVISSAGERGQELTMSHDGAAATVSGDPRRLRQAIVNLLQNAVRYTPNGGLIEVTVRVQGERVLLDVRDNGQGIARDRLELIFDPFVRQSASGPGLGIGLAVARRIAALHDGTVSAASDAPGRGSVFTLALPRADAGRLRSQG